MEEINKLKELTDNLPPVPSLDTMIHNPGKLRNYIEYEVKNGTCIGFGLLNQKEVGVQKIFLSSGSEFPSHVHKYEKEFGIVFSGKLEVKIGDETKIIEKGDCIEFCCNLEHSAKAIEDSWMIAISIPSIEGYPK